MAAEANLRQRRSTSATDIAQSQNGDATATLFRSTTRTLRLPTVGAGAHAVIIQLNRNFIYSTPPPRAEDGVEMVVSRKLTPRQWLGAAALMFALSAAPAALAASRSCAAACSQSRGDVPRQHLQPADYRRFAFESEGDAARGRTVFFLLIAEVVGVEVDLHVRLANHLLQRAARPSMPRPAPVRPGIVGQQLRRLCARASRCADGGAAAFGRGRVEPWRLGVADRRDIRRRRRAMSCPCSS